MNERTRFQNPSHIPYISNRVWSTNQPLHSNGVKNTLSLKEWWPLEIASVCDAKQNQLLTHEWIAAGDDSQSHFLQRRSMSFLSPKLASDLWDASWLLPNRPPAARRIWISSYGSLLCRYKADVRFWRSLYWSVRWCLRNSGFVCPIVAVFVSWHNGTRMQMSLLVEYQFLKINIFELRILGNLFA